MEFVRPGGRVVACRLRGQASYGLIVPIDPTKGDDLNWKTGDDVAEHFKVTKYEPVLECDAKDAEVSHTRFWTYTRIENYGNYPLAIPDGAEVIFTEKIHGTNARMGLILDTDENGVATWTPMAGSFSVRRKKYERIEYRFKVPSLQERGWLTGTPSIGMTLEIEGNRWFIDQVIEPYADPDPEMPLEENVQKVHVYKIDKDGQPLERISSYWEFFDENIKAMFEYVKDNILWHEPMHSILLFGEIYGGQEKMKYGLKSGHAFKAFDLSINNQYLHYDEQLELFSKFGVVPVPILYRGPFSHATLMKYTSGPTTICKPDEAGKFKGREGVIVRPVKENQYSPVLNGRMILKSISADYIAITNGTEGH